MNMVTGVVNSALSAPEVESFKKQLDTVQRQFAGAQGAKVAADKRHEAELLKLRNEERERVATLQADLESLRKIKTSLNQEHLDEIASLRAALEASHVSKETLEKQLSEAQKNASNGASNGIDFAKMAKSFKTLLEDGLMSREEIGEKLESKVLEVGK